MLRAAETVFAQKGYTHATLDEIAERAEFGKGTLYNYFEGGKEEILFAVLDTVYDEVHDLVTSSFAEACHGRTLRACYRDMVKRAITFYQEREDLFVILIKEAYRMCFSHDETKVAYFQRQRARIVNTLMPALEHAVSEGTIRDLPLHSVAHMLIENVDGLIVHRIMVNHNTQTTMCEHGFMLDEPEEAADFLTAMLFDGLGTSAL